MRFAVAVGSNLGDRAATIAHAAELLQAEGDVAIVGRSALIENPALGGPVGQGDFLNGAWLVATGFGPYQLLERLRRVEDRLGRQRLVPWGPRRIDLDLLLAEDGRICRCRMLELPHPRLHERAFVLAPLCELAGDWRHPIIGRSIRELWAALPNASANAATATSR